MTFYAPLPATLRMDFESVANDMRRAASMLNGWPTPETVKAAAEAMGRASVRGRELAQAADAEARAAKAARHADDRDRKATERNNRRIRRERGIPEDMDLAIPAIGCAS